jgi:NADH:ubiquinone oxidoreductase subunit H
MEIKSRLKPEGSITSGIATMGIVYATYQLDVGSVSQAAASDANHPILESSRKKAGYTSFVVVAAISLITRDANVAILGFASIVAMEAHYRHAIMADPTTGIMQPPAGTAYAPAQNVVPFAQQGQAVG